MRIANTSWVLASLALGCGAAPSQRPVSPAPSKAELVLEAYPRAREFGEDGWVLSGGAHDHYAVHRDADGWLLEPVASTFGRYGTWMRSIDAAPYARKRVRITIAVRTSGATNRVDVWSRAEAHDSPADGHGLGGNHKVPPADSAWQSYTMVIDVPAGAAHLQYGVGLAGPGQLWMRDPKLTIVGEDVAVTNNPSNDQRATSDAIDTYDAWPGEQHVAEWTMTGIGAPDYAIASDGDAIRIESTRETKRYVALVNAVPARDFAGKRVHATFDARSDGVEQAACVMKIQREQKLSYGGFLASDFKMLPGTTNGFVACDLNAAVPDGANWIVYGFTYHGAGKAWVRNAKVATR